jgi:hypothetical protein
MLWSAARSTTQVVIFETHEHFCYDQIGRLATEVVTYRTHEQRGCCGQIGRLATEVVTYKTHGHFCCEQRNCCGHDAQATRLLWSTVLVFLLDESFTRSNTRNPKGFSPLPFFTGQQVAT